MRCLRFLSPHMAQGSLQKKRFQEPEVLTNLKETGFSACYRQRHMRMPSNHDSMLQTNLATNQTKSQHRGCEYQIPFKHFTAILLYHILKGFMYLFYSPLCIHTVLPMHVIFCGQSPFGSPILAPTSAFLLTTLLVVFVPIG